jgi:hypothetical protein
MTERLVSAQYTDIDRKTLADVADMTNRLIGGEIPAFIIEDAGSSLEDASAKTIVHTQLMESNYASIKEVSIPDNNALPLFLTDDVPHPEGREWFLRGVTPAHYDVARGSAGLTLYALNMHYTEKGSAEFRLHENRNFNDGIGDSSQATAVTKSLLWDSMADAEIINPRGYKTIVTPGDLMVFDPSYVHIVRTLTAPRLSSVRVYEKSNPLRDRQRAARQQKY